MNKNHITAVLLMSLNVTTLTFANDPNSVFSLTDVAPKGAFTLQFSCHTATSITNDSVLEVAAEQDIGSY